ncbi:hypothetical protein NC653_008768 [Populus alba x Populus x berolinensis]|uniref:Uncharacterized protein n=1 Tax=Populus alba x Populus x berolinensis TaxID=444605 RepID=A0AAD6R786_9ROSI|nr:hypothetical protein NC653_008768 [Populus alba x Populus x berolinensis]
MSSSAIEADALLTQLRPSIVEALSHRPMESLSGPLQHFSFSFDFIFIKKL